LLYHVQRQGITPAVTDFRFSSSTESSSTGNLPGNYRNCGIANPVLCTYPEGGKSGGKVLSWAFVFLAMGIGVGMLGFGGMEAAAVGAARFCCFLFQTLFLIAFGTHLARSR